jgi:uncharacterized membrane protein
MKQTSAVRLVAIAGSAIAVFVYGVLFYLDFGGWTDTGESPLTFPAMLHITLIAGLAPLVLSLWLLGKATRFRDLLVGGLFVGTFIVLHLFVATFIAHNDQIMGLFVMMVELVLALALLVFLQLKRKGFSSPTAR